MCGEHSVWSKVEEGDKINLATEGGGDKVRVNLEVCFVREHHGFKEIRFKEMDWQVVLVRKKFVFITKHGKPTERPPEEGGRLERAKKVEELFREMTSNNQKFDSDRVLP